MSETATQKTCLRCGPRPVGDFGADAKARDGLRPYCRPCQAQAARESRQRKTHGTPTERKERTQRPKAPAAEPLSDDVDSMERFRETGYWVVRGAATGRVDDDGRPLHSFRSVAAGAALSAADVVIARFAWDGGKWRGAA